MGISEVGVPAFLEMLKTIGPEALMQGAMDTGGAELANMGASALGVGGAEEFLGMGAIPKVPGPAGEGMLSNSNLTKAVLALTAGKLAGNMLGLGFPPVPDQPLPSPVGRAAGGATPGRPTADSAMRALMEQSAARRQTAPRKYF